MKEKKEIKVGDEVLVDGYIWAQVEVVEDGGYIYAIDQDGNDLHVRSASVDLY